MNIKHFDERRLHAFNKLSFVPEHVRKGKFIDIGCGIGNGVIAALQHGASMAVGLDRDLFEFGHEVDPGDFEEICRNYNVNFDKALLIQADIFATKFPQGTFDYALMLDSMEHVPDPKKFIEYAYACLKPGGFLVVDTCPLYYSPIGHHLFQWFSREIDPWAHLKYGFEEKLESLGIDSWTMQRVNELNQVTHSQIVDFFLEAGFSIVKEHRTKPSDDDLKMLEQHKEQIDFTRIKDLNSLFEDWILLVAVKK